MTTKKHNVKQLTLNFNATDKTEGVVNASIVNGSNTESRELEIKRARDILVYVNRIHQCIDDVYEHLVDREYQDFQDEVETAIEYLEYLRDNGNKKF
jgi:hypothetical protein